MAGENAKEISVNIVEEGRRCMVEALDRFKSEAEKRFSRIAS